MPAEVKLFECEAMRKRWRGVSFSPVSRLARPNACSATISPRWANATITLGCWIVVCWNSIQEPLYSIADRSHLSIAHRFAMARLVGKLAENAERAQP